MASLFERALAGPIYDANQQAWNEVLGTLNLRPCYQPAVMKVLSEGRWRNKGNPRAYVATAAARQALAMHLLDFTDREFRRVASSNLRDNGPTVRHSISPPRGNDEDGEPVLDIIENASSSGGDIYTRTESGAVRWLEGYGDDDFQHNIPGWLQRGEEYDAVDWETVAIYAAHKPRMVLALALTLILRFEDRIGRPTAVAAASSLEEAREVEAAWKWIDRNWSDRLAPLFRMKAPPRQLSAGDVAAFPMLAAGVSLRLDTYVQWDGSIVGLLRGGLRQVAAGVLVPAYGIEAASLDEVAQVLCEFARDDEPPPELFHIWPGVNELGTERSEIKLIVVSRGPSGTPPEKRQETIELLFPAPQKNVPKLTAVPHVFQ